MTAKEKLTALADAVREKTGETGLLSLDSMTSLIKALNIGGGTSLPHGWAMGEFNTTEATAEGGFKIEHGLGTVPEYILIWSTATEPISGAWRMLVKVNVGKEYNPEAEDADGNIYGRYEPLNVMDYGAKDMGTGVRATPCDANDVDDDTYIDVPFYTNTVYPPDITYRWLAVTLEV